MYSVKYKHEGKESTTSTDAKTEREARALFAKSLAAAEIYWDSFEKVGFKQIPTKTKEAKSEIKPDVHV